MTHIDCDVLIVGAGIVGASTAWQLKNAYPDYRIIVLEKDLIDILLCYLSITINKCLLNQFILIFLPKKSFGKA